MDEKTVMCFGDSNTWGADPSGGPRFDRSTRWPCLMQTALGETCHVVEEGLGGRTTVWDDPVEGDRCGLKHLVPLIQSHHPLDVLIIMLGTNDLKNRFSVSAMDVSWSIGRLVEAARGCPDPHSGNPPELLVICPPPFADMRLSPLHDIFVGGEEKSHQLASALRRFCDEKRVRMLNACDVVQSSPVDGIHLDAAEHRKLGTAVAAEVRDMC